MKYTIIYVYDGNSAKLEEVNNPYGLMPGSMFEYDRADSLEEANKKAKAFNAVGGHILILPYYEVEK